jgi:Ca-activated chloride channel family protein
MHGLDPPGCRNLLIPFNKPGGKGIVRSEGVTKRLILVLLGGLLGVAATGASARGTAAPSAQGPPVFSSGVDAVVVNVTVRNARGRIIRDLQKEDFQVIDSGFGKPIQEFHAGRAPISVAVLLDISGSMAVGGNMDRARHAVEIATTHLRDESDEAALFTFDSILEQVVPFTRELDRVRRVSLEGTPWGKTSLFDAIALAARAVAERDNRHRAVLVITDGVDTGSELTAAQVSGIASAIDVPVYLLAVVHPLDHHGTEFAVTAAEQRVADTATLADLARWTGGDMRTASVRTHTEQELEDLFAELRYHYVIMFEPGARPGWHPIEIRTRNKSHVVRARGGYVSTPRQGS